MRRKRALGPRRRRSRCPATCRRSRRRCSSRGRGREELDPSERQLRADALLPRQPDQREQRRQAAAGVRVPDRRAGVDGDRADRRQRRHVPHDVVQSRLRDQRGDRRGILALQAQDGSDHDVLLRPEQPRRRDRRRSAVHGHARREARRARCEDRQAAVGDADRRSRKRAIRKRWRPRSSTARC